MVFQSYELFPHLTVMGNLTLAPGLVAGESRADAEERAHKLLERVGLADRADDYPRQLSGGQRQRVAIVRALMMNPEILLLDEVTASLDPEMVREVLDVVLELARTGMTMLIVTHEMGFARAIADRIVVMDEGRIVEVDPPRKFFADPSSDRARRFLDIFSFEGAKLSACRGSRRGLCGGAGRWFVPPVVALVAVRPGYFPGAGGVVLAGPGCLVRPWAAARPLEKPHASLRLGVIDLEARPGLAAAHGRRSLDQQCAGLTPSAFWLVPKWCDTTERGITPLPRGCNAP